MTEPQPIERDDELEDVQAAIICTHQQLTPCKWYSAAGSPTGTSGYFCRCTLCGRWFTC